MNTGKILSYFTYFQKYVDKLKKIGYNIKCMITLGGIFL